MINRRFESHYTVEAAYIGRLGVGSTISVVSYISSTIDWARGPKYARQLSVVSYTRVTFKRLPLYC